MKTYRKRYPKGSRKAHSLEVRYCKVAIARPATLKKTELPESVELYAIEVKEINAPKGVSAICWRLLTTHPVTTYEKR